MDILYLLIPVSLLFFVVALRLFFWAVGSGQFEDLDGAAHGILFDNDRDLPGAETPNKKCADMTVVDDADVNRQAGGTDRDGQ